MNYEEAVRYLLTLGSELAAPRHGRAAKFDLENITVLAERLGAPHRACPCVHVAGTNGKGSTAAMLESILRAAGLKTGLFTSPHLERINERIRLGGAEISDLEFAAAFTRLHALIESLLAQGPEASGLRAHPTFFECLTAMAFDCFAREKVGLAVFEVGMGGRLDSTNVIAPEVAVITQIDFDHENFLGHSIEEIAAEKAGIIKPGIPVVSAAGRPEAQAIIRRRCDELGSRLLEIEAAYEFRSTGVSPVVFAAQRVVLSDRRSNWKVELSIPLLGRYQIRNAVTAVAAARILAERGFPITGDAIARGIAGVHWPGRLEVIQESPLVFLDGTHNPAGARELLAFWDDALAGRRIHLVYGAVRDKAVDEIAGLLFPLATSVTLTQPRQPRAISAAALAEMTAHHAHDARVIADPATALERAIERATGDGVVFVTGSLYLAGDLRRYWRARGKGLASTRRSA